MLRTRASFSLVVSLIIAAATPAARADVCSAAGNLVVNCGFESPTQTNVPPGWTVQNWLGEEAITTNPVNSGTFSLRISNDFQQGGTDPNLFNGAAVLSQTFTDTPDEIYTFDFYLADGAPDGSSELFQAFFDSTSGSPLLANTGTGLSASSFTEYSFSVTGTGSDTITFTAYNNPDWFYLDDVEVLDTGVNTGSPSAVPEPASLALFGTGLASIVGVTRRKIKSR